MDLQKPGNVQSEQREDLVLPTSTTKFSLAEQADEWHYFNHGALFQYGGLTFPDEDPVSDWFKHQPINTTVIRQPFKARLFDGLVGSAGPTSWGHTIMAVRHEYWQSLWEFLGGVVTFDGDKGVYCQVFSGDLKIVDPVFAERHSFLHPEAPQITVTVFCIDANDRRMEIRPPITPGQRPFFIQLPARPEVTEIGRAVIAGKIDALQHKDNPAFQPLLDKYTALRERGSDESIVRDAKRR